jgi:hypothetical protein
LFRKLTELRRHPFAEFLVPAAEAAHESRFNFPEKARSIGVCERTRKVKKVPGHSSDEQRSGFGERFGGKTHSPTTAERVQTDFPE